MTLWETIKKPFLKPPEEQELSSSVQKNNIIADLSGDNYTNSMAFFDNTQQGAGIFGATTSQNLLELQKRKIELYRNLSENPDVSDAIEEIINETVFSLDDEMPIKIDINEENKTIKDKLTESFNEVNKIMKTKKNLYNLIKTAYVDGQLILHVSYDKNNLSKGIQGIKIIDPCYFYFDKSKNVYKYDTKQDSNYIFGSNASIEYSPEEIVKIDFGLYKNGLTLSYLDGAVKTANQLRALEDLLVPLRFSRSMSRRVFNVDIGDLPNKKGEEVMKDIQTKFKYKKFYNAETGEVTNQQHIMSMVEDYWFANRSGGKGTEVSTLDESGNLGELDDILYFYKKLYKAMKIPSNRIPNVDNDVTFDYDTTAVSKEDMKFFIFISRLRQVFSEMFRTLLQYQVISTGTMSADEFEDYDEKIRIYFTNENAFVKKMHSAEFMAQLDSWSTAKEVLGTVFSAEELYMKIFKMNMEDVEAEIKKIQKEEGNKLFAKFYAKEED